MPVETHLPELLTQKILREDDRAGLKLVRSTFRVWSERKKTWAATPKISYEIVEIKTEQVVRHCQTLSSALTAFAGRCAARTPL